MDFLIVFGSILLILSIILSFKLKLTVNNPNCPEEVNDVKCNKINLIITFIVGIILVLIGIFCR